MSCYLTVEKFKASPYYCSFPKCCEPENIDQTIEDLIEESVGLIDSFIGHSLCPTIYEEVFMGNYNNEYFTKVTPIIIDPEDETTVMELKSINYLDAFDSTIEKTIETQFRVPELHIGKVLTRNCLKSNREYTLKYKAGYKVIPRDIVTATCMLVLNLAQRIDNNNMSNPDISISSVSVDKSASFTFSNSNSVKQLVAKSILDFNDLPLPVLKILNKYRRKIS